MAGVETDALIRLVGQKLEEVIHLTFTDDTYKDLFLRVYMFRTSRAHVSFSKDEIETFVISWQTFLWQLNDYFLHNVYKSDKMMTTQTKPIVFKTNQDKARAYESKLGNDLLIQYSDFLSTLIAEPTLIRQIQRQVKVGSPAAFATLVVRSLVGDCGGKLLKYTTITFFLFKITYNAHYNEAETGVVLALIGVDVMVVSYFMYSLFVKYTNKRKALEDGKMYIDNIISEIKSNVYILEEFNVKTEEEIRQLESYSRENNDNLQNILDIQEGMTRFKKKQILKSVRDYNVFENVKDSIYRNIRGLNYTISDLKKNEDDRVVLALRKHYIEQINDIKNPRQKRLLKREGINDDIFE